MDENDKVDELMLPGFRFHPTDEELVGFYLKRKIQQKPLSVELIKQLDIYKYDPWDLPNLATTGEKDWYFYCPRDRKYRNSARPNRVTGAGFWKATGTDRPVYSSEGTRCIGLKKSLVFYRGRAAKGIKTDWMMHEFRLPSLVDSSTPTKRPLDKKLPANLNWESQGGNPVKLEMILLKFPCCIATSMSLGCPNFLDSWAICRIFKKTNSMAQKALSHSWTSPFPETTGDPLTQGAHCTHFSSENISCTAEAGSAIQFCNNNDLQHSSAASLSPIDIPSNKSINPTNCKPSLLPFSNGDLPAGLMFSPFEMPVPNKYTVDVASMLLNLSPAILGDVGKAAESIDCAGLQQQCNSFSVTLPREMEGNMVTGEEQACLRKNSNGFDINNQWGTVRSVGFPFSLPSDLPDAWNPSLQWDSLPTPSEMSTSYFTKCHT